MFDGSAQPRAPGRGDGFEQARIGGLNNYTRTIDWETETSVETFDREPGLTPADTHHPGRALGESNRSMTRPARPRWTVTTIPGSQSPATISSRLRPVWNSVCAPWLLSVVQRERTTASRSALPFSRASNSLDTFSVS